MAQIVTNGYPVFTGTDGQPLEEGYIYIGVEGQNPLSSPQQAYWDVDLTVPAANIRTSGGYPQYQGSPGRLYTANEYSLLVQDRYHRTVYYQPTSADSTGEATSTDPDVAGGLPLGAVLPKNGVAFKGFLDLGSVGVSDTDYPELAASGLDIINDNGNGTFNILNSGGSTGWIAFSAWQNSEITVAHGLQKDLTELDVEVFVSSSASDSNAFRVLNTAYDAAAASDNFLGMTLIGVGNASFILRTGTNGVSAVNSDGTHLILTNQSWHYKVNYRRKDMPYPGQVNATSTAFTVDGGDAPTQMIALKFRRDTSADWTASNPVLALGEAGYSVDTGEFKIGDGATAWNSLSVVNTGVTANLTGVVGTDRTFLEDDGGVVKVSVGSVIEANGTIYTVTGSATTPSGTPGSGAYLFFDSSTTTYTWSTTAGTFDASKGGKYDASNRRQCRYRLSSATTWDRIVVDGAPNAMFDGDLKVDGTLDAPTLNTGQGDNELYPMNQAVRTTDSPTFVHVSSTFSGTLFGPDNYLTELGAVQASNLRSDLIALGVPNDWYVRCTGWVFRESTGRRYFIHSIKYDSSTIYIQHDIYDDGTGPETTTVPNATFGMADLMRWRLQL